MKIQIQAIEPTLDNNKREIFSITFMTFLNKDELFELMKHTDPLLPYTYEVEVKK